MRRRFLIILGVFIVLIIAGIIFLERRTESHSRADALPEIPKALASGSNIPPRTVSTPASAEKESNYVRHYFEHIKADPNFDWKQPINFYGKVVDENSQPVSDALVHFVWTDISATGTSGYDTKSDAAGIFSLQKKAGKRLSVDVTKPGYYTRPSERLSTFEYASPYEGRFTPDSNNPVVFHLRKKGAI